MTEPVGGVQVFTLQQPAWITALVDAILDLFHPASPTGPLACRFWEPATEDANEWWTISVFPTAAEVVGGVHDGSKAHVGFHLDVLGVLQLFSDVSDLRWHAPVSFDPSRFNGPRLLVEGKFLGKNVRLEFHQQPPRDEPAGAVIDAVGGQVHSK